LEDFVMDLGIRGKKAIVCASSKGLGRGCAMALAEAGCDIVVNGRNADLLARTAAELRERYGVTVTAIAGCVVSDGILGAEEGYNSTMKPLLNRKFGHDIFKEAEEVSRK